LRQLLRNWTIRPIAGNEEAKLRQLSGNNGARFD
jgi:hypothetical protein